MRKMKIHYKQTLVGTILCLGSFAFAACGSGTNGQTVTENTEAPPPVYGEGPPPMDPDPGVPGNPADDPFQGTAHVKQTLQEGFEQIGLPYEAAKQQAEKVGILILAAALDEEKIRQQIHDALTEVGIAKEEADREAQKLARLIHREITNRIVIPVSGRIDNPLKD